MRMLCSLTIAEIGFCHFLLKKFKRTVMVTHNYFRSACVDLHLITLHIRNFYEGNEKMPRLSVCHVKHHRHLKDEVHDNMILQCLNWTFKLSLVRDVYSLKHCMNIKIYPHLILYESQDFKISRQFRSLFRPFSPDHSLNNIEKLASSKFWFCVRRAISNALIYPECGKFGPSGGETERVWFAFLNF
jgi:hypothetical protein